MIYPTIHVIHNSDRADRKKVLLGEFEKQGIRNYVFFPSVHDVELVQKGINKAHKNIIQYAKENNLESVLIAEDDIQFFDEGAFDFYIKNKPDDYDIYLGGIYLGEIEYGITKRFTGMTLYMVHNKFYDTFLSTDEYEHIDISLAYLGKYVVCDPFVVRQHNGISDNEKKYMNYDFMFDYRNCFKFTNQN